MEPRQQLSIIIPSLTEIVGNITPDQLDDPTPCATFTIRGVLEHMIGGARSFAPAFRGIPPDGAAAIPTQQDQHPAALFRQAMVELLDAVSTTGALDRTIQSPFGAVTGEVFARFVAFDGLIHGWDLTQATNQPYEPPAELVAAVDAFARQAITPDLRDGDTFRPPTQPPPHANTLQRLVAYTGREI
ncbi:MAG: TIGR03086 family metal-binding protein [Ilumatobacteraceae bacterium]